MSSGAQEVGFGLPSGEEQWVDSRPSQIAQEVGNLASIELAPDPIPHTERDSDGRPLPPTTLDTQEVKRLLDKNNTTTPDIRTSLLLDYAWKASPIVVRSAPAHLLAHIPKSPGEWYQNNREVIEEILAGKRSSRLSEHFPDIFDAEVLEDETTKFNDTPFVRNARRIKKESWNSKEGVRVLAGARLILYEAEQSFLADLLKS